MEISYSEYDWEQILSKGTEIRLKEGGKIAANPVYRTPQTIEITGASDTKIPKGDPDLPDTFAGLPASVELRGVRDTDEYYTETPTNTLYVIESLTRGDGKVVKK